ncbi:UNKNOWN [Stylonychia lemnae]|uniref:Uncharacterized protein n=1 Tax=Stylonychia lemnae TaxID=5949 RepID=A0A078AFE6_STYLE|nr:UNKNOWN [Stylonychia lemnae]|eukprot:CDW80895.1 UNKNOWN [Stylonychia lemnae]
MDAPPEQEKKVSLLSLLLYGSEHRLNQVIRFMKANEKMKNEGLLQSVTSKIIVSLNNPQNLLDALPQEFFNSAYSYAQYFYNFKFENLQQNQGILLELLKNSKDELVQQIRSKHEAVIDLEMGEHLRMIQFSPGDNLDEIKEPAQDEIYLSQVRQDQHQQQLKNLHPRYSTYIKLHLNGQHQHIS